MKRLSLAQMGARQKGKVAEILGSAALRNKLINMGIYPGTEIIKLSYFALSGPVAVEVSRIVFALSYNMASKIIVEIE